MSGWAPTRTALEARSERALPSSSQPGSVLVGASTAATTRPSERTATELMLAPAGIGPPGAGVPSAVIVPMRLGWEGSRESRTSIVPASAFTVNVRRVAGWKATISAAPASKTPVSNVPTGSRLIVASSAEVPRTGTSAWAAVRGVMRTAAPRSAAPRRAKDMRGG